MKAYFRPLVKNFEQISDLPFGFYAKEPSDFDLWYGFMMMVALSVTEIEEGTGSRVVNLLRAFTYDGNHGEHAQGLAWLLFAPLQSVSLSVFRSLLLLFFSNVLLLLFTECCWIGKCVQIRQECKAFFQSCHYDYFEI